MNRVLLCLSLLILASTPSRAQQGNDAPYNNLILQQINTMPHGGGYSASHLANVKLGSSVTLADPNGLNVAAPLAQPSYCSGATYLVFLKTIDALCGMSVIPSDSRAMAALLITGQRDGEGIWGRWNANGPGTARLFFETGLGRNFSDWSQARPGDFMKIWWTTAVGRRERGHSVIFLGTEIVNGVDSVRFWSSNLGVGYSEKTVPRSKVAAVVFSRLTQPQNVNRAALLVPRVDPYLARLLSTDSDQAQVRAVCGIAKKDEG